MDRELYTKPCDTISSTHFFQKAWTGVFIGQISAPESLLHYSSLKGAQREILIQWFSNFRMLTPFNTVPHIVVTSNYKIIFIATS